MHRLLATTCCAHGLGPSLAAHKTRAIVRAFSTLVRNPGTASLASLADAEQFLRTFGPAFTMDGSCIEVLSSPAQFYDTLIHGIESAQERIVLSSLYLGSGALEQQLVRALTDKSLERANANATFKASVLLDFTRGTRGQKNSVSMLLPWRQQYSHVQVALYHSPNLRGLLRMLPPPFNEVIGLNHLKVYCFDDTLVLSGANLSHDYFTARQDRYLLFRDARLAAFFTELVDIVSKFSFAVQASGELSCDPGLHPVTAPHTHLKAEMQRSVAALMAHHRESATAAPPANTTVFPLLQMGQFGVCQDFHATMALLGGMASGWQLHFATGYFNLVQQYVDAILASGAEYHILTASPQANGFLGARGIMGHIPAAYTFIAQQFLARVRASRCHSVTLYEYARHGWTFHAKGLWAAPPAAPSSCAAPAEGPGLTLVGSPNYGHRSVHRDIEAQVAVLTSCPVLQRALRVEQQALFAHASPVTLEALRAEPRRVALWEAAATRLIRGFF